jgi:hypothetical protein
VWLVVLGLVVLGLWLGWWFCVVVILFTVVVSMLETLTGCATAQKENKCQYLFSVGPPAHFSPLVGRGF